jgi:hypothetical protein
MAKILINYAHNGYYEAQKINTATAASFNCFDYIYECGIKDIDEDFYKKHCHILNLKRGSGYWLWKPYLIYKFLKTISENDILFYCDSGSHFINSIDCLIECVDLNKNPIVPFGVDPHLNSTFTKMDLFVFNECENISEITHAVMVLSSFHLIKNCQYSRDFYKNFLFQACHSNLITDESNIFGKENFNNFCDHRHDQSIYSVLCRKENLEIFRDPSNFGNPFVDIYPNSTYPQIIEHTRKRT